MINFIKALIFDLLRDLVTLVIYLMKQGYKFGEAVVIAVQNGYVTFSRSVDNASRRYLSLKEGIKKRLVRK